MNKVNLCWVIADGRAGHDIQSQTLANAISHQVNTFPFSMMPLWRWLAPRVAPVMNSGLKWRDQNPLISEQKPELLITTGRRAAAVGKFIKRRLAKSGHPCKQIQILNPKDNPGNYDLLLIPEHDQKLGKNIITFRGSLHAYGSDWHSSRSAGSALAHQFLTLLLGNPGNWYWNGPFDAELRQIREAFPGYPVYFCGSPRLTTVQQQLIRRLTKPADEFWFSEVDGSNPYPALLCHSKKLFVTADSINMMNECLSGSTPRSLLAVDQLPSARHQHFIDANQKHFSVIADSQPATALEDPLSEVLKHPSLQSLMEQA